MYRFVLTIGLLLPALPLLGCNPGGGQTGKPSAPAPIASGELISVTAYPKPIQQLNEDGFKEYRGGRVEVYDHFILITESGGQKTVIPHGWYKNLQFK